MGAGVEGEVVKGGERDVVRGGKCVFGMEVLKEIGRGKVSGWPEVGAARKGTMGVETHLSMISEK